MHLFRRSWINQAEKYNLKQMTTKTESLIQAASSSRENDASFNKAERTLPSREAAAELFQKVRKKLRNVHEWGEHSGVSNFALFESDGRVAEDGKVTDGRFVRIHLPATGKYDWVRIEDVRETEEETVITVRPTYDPTARPVDKKVISHFFADTAMNNFCVLLRGNTVGVYVVGLGEKQNTSATAGIVDAARNVAVANLGSYLGVQSAEWTKFCNDLLGSGDDK